MHRNELISALERYIPVNQYDSSAKEQMLQFVKQNSDCFRRSNCAGHLTASAWLIDREARRVLLTHHKKLGKWLQLGGHADGQTDLLAVALEEAREESGISGIRAVSGEIFDIDVHDIPPHQEVPEHQHYDVRFLMQTTENDSFQVSEESNALRWFTPEELRALNPEESIARMLEKWHPTV